MSLIPFFSFCQLDCNSNNIDANNICRVLYSTAASPNAATNFEDFLVNLIKGETSYSEREKAEIVSVFFNKNNSCLICGDDSDVKIRENEHLLKRSISSNGYQFLEKVVTSEYYNFDFNYYEIVDGEKETILDFLDKILSDETLLQGYSKGNLEELIIYIEDAGGKRANELK